MMVGSWCRRYGLSFERLQQPAASLSLALLSSVLDASLSPMLRLCG
jgi:hypothetical protein